MTTTLITGANRGLGLEFARQLTRAGQTVIGTARDPGAAADLRATGARVEQLDAADEESASALAERLAGEPIDVLINNAGVFPDHGAGSFLQTTGDQLLTGYRVNVLGPLFVTRALLPHIERSDRRLVVQITSEMGSIAGARSSNARGNLAYRSSKSALNMVNALMAPELADRRVTSIVLHPGWVKTDMGGSNAPLTPDAAIGSMLALIDRLTPDDAGKFFSYNGSELPW